MLSLQGIAVLLLLSDISQAFPRRDERNALGKVWKGFVLEPRQVGGFSDIVGVLSTSSTEYRTMPPGTYTESISTGLVRIIVVNNPTPTTTSNCPAECDCSGIKDKKSPEYFQCLTNSRCRPCREPVLTSSSSTAKPTATCPPYCDCTRFKNKQSEEYFQCLTNINCQKCRVGGPPNSI